MTNDFFNNIYSSTHTSGHYQSFFLNSNFLAESLKPTKTIENNQFFYDTVLLKNLTHFTNLNSLNIEKNMLPQHIQKPFSLYKCSSKHLVGVKKNICTAPFLDAQEMHSQSTLKANVCIFLYISVRKCLFQRRSKFFIRWDVGEEVDE